MLRTYFLLTKPGIILGNLITTAGGFALASKGHFDLKLFLWTLLGLGLVIASACVFNNYSDRHVDEKMERTKNRALAQKLISGKSALIFASFLNLFGFFILALKTTILAAAVAFIGFFVYVILYDIWKYRSSYGTLIGSIAGAIPPVVGYTAASNHFDLGALLLFLILVLWQMPHFFSIALFRLDDYKAAEIPVFPIEKGTRATKIQMVWYIIGFIVAAFMLTLFGYTGYPYLFITAGLGFSWLFLCLKGFNFHDDKLWAKRMFRLSLVIILLLSLMISIDTV